MKYIILILVLPCFISCNNKRELQLPEIEKANITEIQDVSAAYLFYDETQPDSVLLNRKNLISTTNWLVNVDRRLRLRQAIPHIKFLQSKKKSSSHKNENAKNYLTCHDLSKNNLGFLEFTDVVYHNDFEASRMAYDSIMIDKIFEEIDKMDLDTTKVNFFNTFGMQISEYHCQINFETNDSVFISRSHAQPFLIKISKDELINYLKVNDTLDCSFIISFHQDIFFNEYVKFKSSLQKFEFKNIRLLNNEFLHY